MACWLLDALVKIYPRLKKIWGDAAYRGQFVTRAAEQSIDVDIVTRSTKTPRFTVQPRRWVIERTFAWLNHYRRLSKDYEYWMQTADAMIYAAMMHLMIRRLAYLQSQCLLFKRSLTIAIFQIIQVSPKPAILQADNWPDAEF